MQQKPNQMKMMTQLTLLQIALNFRVELSHAQVDFRIK